MGDFTEHVLFGFLSAAVLAYFLKNLLVLETTELLAAVLSVFVGSVLPDIDNKNAYVHRAAKAFISLSAALLALVVSPGSLPFRFSAAVAALLISYAALSLKKIRHRGFTHTVSFAVTLTALASIGSMAAFKSAVPGVALGIGLGSHLLLDREVF